MAVKYCIVCDRRTGPMVAVWVPSCEKCQPKEEICYLHKFEAVTNDE